MILERWASQGRLGHTIPVGWNVSILRFRQHHKSPLLHQHRHDSKMSGRQGYDVVVDVDAEVGDTGKCDRQHALTRQQGDLGHTDLNDDLEFHNSSMQ